MISEITEKQHEKLRYKMVKEQLQGRDIRDHLVLNAMEVVPRHEFVPPGYQKLAYQDSPLPIGEGQTISQPYIVALMSEKLEIEPGNSVLEVGTGSGYQAAVLAQMGARVYSIEIVSELGKRAEKVLTRLGYNVKVKIGDGYKGWKKYAPYDKIIVTAAAPKIPEPLLQQLKIGGKLIIPVDRGFQELILVIKTKNSYIKQNIASVMFVPMIGEVQKK